MLQPNRCISQKTYYFSETKTFWVIQNNSLPLECINKIHKRKNAKQIRKFDFSTLYAKMWGIFAESVEKSNLRICEIFYIKLQISCLKKVLGIT